jgi:hypothetical protein
MIEMYSERCEFVIYMLFWKFVQNNSYIASNYK